MKNNFILKRIFTVIAIPVAGFVLLNLTFILDFLFQSMLDKFFPVDYNMTKQWYAMNKHILFAAIIISISLFIFKSKLKDLYKAIYSTVPTAVILVTLGMLLYRWPAPMYIVSALIYGAIILYLYKRKKPWLYYYAVTLVSFTLLIMGILRVEI